MPRLSQPTSSRPSFGFGCGVAGALLAAALCLHGTPARADDMPTFNILAKAGRLTPETLEVPANTKFRLMLKNEGPEAAEFEMSNPVKEKVLAPGSERALIFLPLPPGTYLFFDDFHPKTAQGRIIAK